MGHVGYVDHVESLRSCIQRELHDARIAGGVGDPAGRGAVDRTFGIRPVHRVEQVERLDADSKRRPPAMFTLRENARSVFLNFGPVR